MKKNKKGFTLVELAIVISVIAILAAVLIPTFSGIVQRAKESARMQAVIGARDEFFTGSKLFDSLDEMNGYVFVIDEKAYKIENNKINFDENFDYDNYQPVIASNFISNDSISIYSPNDEENGNNNNNNESNNNATGIDFDDAIVINPSTNTYVDGYIESFSDKYYTFAPNESGNYAIYTESQDCIVGSLYDSERQLIVSNNSYGPGENFMVCYPLTANETYFIKVYANTFNSVEFSLHIETRPLVLEIDSYPTSDRGDTIYLYFDYGYSITYGPTGNNNSVILIIDDENYGVFSTNNYAFSSITFNGDEWIEYDVHTITEDLVINVTFVQSTFIQLWELFDDATLCCDLSFTTNNKVIIYEEYDEGTQTDFYLFSFGSNYIFKRVACDELDDIIFNNNDVSMIDEILNAIDTDGYYETSLISAGDTFGIYIHYRAGMTRDQATIY